MAKNIMSQNIAHVVLADGTSAARRTRATIADHLVTMAVAAAVMTRVMTRVVIRATSRGAIASPGRACSGSP